MNTYEQGLYILRLFVITISALILVLIINLSDLDPGSTTHLHVDTHTATVMYSAPFWEQPGVIDTTQYTQENMNAIYPNRSESLGFYVDFTLRGDDFEKVLVLHPQEKQRLLPFVQAGVRGLHRETTAFPVTYDDNKTGVLIAEAVYES